jgi:hypothetical protein
MLAALNLQTVGDCRCWVANESCITRLLLRVLSHRGYDIQLMVAASVVSRRKKLTRRGRTGSSALRRQETPFASFESRPNSSYAQHLHQSKSLPPTPPLGSDSSFETRSSPSTNSSRHCSLALYPGGRVLEATPPPDARRFQLPHPAANQPQGNAQAANLQQLSAPLGMVQGQPTAASYFHPALPATAATHPQISNLYYQQPMPHAFPPMAAPLAFPASGNNPWQHHHYLNPVHGMAYPQSQDRYICPTCSKAFSRPSSLRIHSHSHTGEKPFKCPHAGCGKAFSVRSNMKRHERGCHTFMVNSNQSL